jgi:hypothetical protein
MSCNECGYAGPVKVTDECSYEGGCGGKLKVSLHSRRKTGDFLGCDGSDAMPSNR